MKHKVTHFAIHADDLERARAFYSKLFNWKFQDYGPHDFKQIVTGDSGNEELIGALQSRRYSPLDQPLLGLEGTVMVENVDPLIEKITSAGGTICMDKAAIPGVGWVVKFRDTEGNLMCIMSLDPDAV